jgi:catechol 2,3-dioxygenase-like lactoylglutathione lyase family enzyme
VTVAPAFQVDSLDHLVLTVRDIARTCAFYEKALGMQRRTFGPDRRTALHFGRQKVNLHPTSHVLDPNVRHATPGSADLCFLTTTPIAEVVTHLAALGIPVILGPVSRTGAQGQLLSVYVYDPDENLIEIANLAG